MRKQYCVAVRNQALATEPSLVSGHTPYTETVTCTTEAYVELGEKIANFFLNLQSASFTTFGRGILFFL